MFLKTPTVLYPTLVKGVIIAPEIRCESIDGSELWLPSSYGEMWFQNARPFVHSDGKTYAISHLQKKATYFSLLYDPFIYHWGKFWHLQEQRQDGSWIPGTERGIYWRTPGWRWQKPDANSNGTPWIFSGGRIPGMHLD